MVNKSCFAILIWIYTPNVQRSMFNFCLEIQTIMEIISVDFYKSIVSHYLVKPLYHYSAQGPTMKSNSAPSPQHNVAHNVDYTATVQHCIGGGGGGAKFRKSFKSLRLSLKNEALSHFQDEKKSPYFKSISPNPFR